jgi:hypothetical protein
MTTSLKDALISAYDRQYRVDEEGRVVSPSGVYLKLSPDKWGYLGFSIGLNKTVRTVPVHRLLAYQVFGDKIFEQDILVRHLDGNCQRNLSSNIDIGTQTNNMMDIPVAKRVLHALEAAKVQRKLSEEEVKQLRLDRAGGMKYDELVVKYRISKSTVSYIVNNKTYKM